MAEYNPGKEQVRVTAAPNLQTERARFDGPDSVDQLLAALGSESTQRALQQFDEQAKAKELQAQQGKLDWYVEQFAQDHAGGAVSQAQVKERFPETVPVIAARVADAIGHREGKKLFQTAIDEVNGNDALRLDTKARAAFLAQKRQEITATVGEGNDFYGAGMVGAIDKLTNQFEQNWAAETAKYHEQAQAEKFSQEAVEALTSENPGAALLALDARYETSSSLNRLERKRAVVNAAIDYAVAERNPDSLDYIPQRFLNADSKAAVAASKDRIRGLRMDDARNADWLQKKMRDDALQASKAEITKAAAEGKKIDPGLYFAQPEVYDFAMRMRDADTRDPGRSSMVRESIRSAILTRAAMESVGTVEALNAIIMNHPELNPRDVHALVEEMPKLVEGRKIMSDPDVTGPMNRLLRSALDNLGRSVNASLQALVTGRNLEMHVMRSFEDDLHARFRAHYENPATRGQWPTGTVKYQLVKEATEQAALEIERQTRLATAGDTPAPTAPRPSAQRPSPIAHNPATARPSAAGSTPTQSAIAAELARRTQ